MKKIFIISIVSLVIIAVSYGVGRWSAPTKVVEKTKIKVVTKTVEARNVKKNVVTTTTKKKDGSVVTIVEDKSIVNIDTKTDTDSKSWITRVETRDMPKWHISGLWGIDLKKPQHGFNYGISVDRRIIGPVWLGGIYIHEPKFIGLKLSVSF
jgi:hypothetical protein